MIYDVIIVGAGAAGLMTAITASRGGMSILLLEGQSQPGAKILTSGGGRCNITHKDVSEKDFNSKRILCMRPVLLSFKYTDTIQFFKDLGVEVILEPGGKYFPASHGGKTVLAALLRKVHAQENITFYCGHKVRAVGKGKEGFTLQGENFHYQGKTLVLTTGGLSYPATGSDGAGYRLAQSFGHSMVETSPALTPLTTRDKDFHSLSGMTLDVGLTLVIDGKKDFFSRNSFLFTHFGFSGPGVLDISRHYLRSQGKKHIMADFIPDYETNSLQTHLCKIQQASPRKTIKNVLIELMPQRLADIILKKADIDASLTMNQLNKPARQRLIDCCVRYPLDVTGTLGYSKAEVTAGGVDLAEINPKTLESKLAPGLFFAGEILDVDGRIGGFNFQWAWASGHAVGETLIKQKPRLSVVTSGGVQMENSREQKNH